MGCGADERQKMKGKVRWLYGKSARVTGFSSFQIIGQAKMGEPVSDSGRGQARCLLSGMGQKALVSQRLYMNGYSYIRKGQA